MTAGDLQILAEVVEFMRDKQQNANNEQLQKALGEQVKNWQRVHEAARRVSEGAVA